MTGHYLSVKGVLAAEDGSREASVEGTCIIDRPANGGLNSWLGWGWTNERLTPGGYSLRLTDGSTTRVLVRRVLEQSDHTGHTVKVEFVGNGPAPDGGWSA